MSLFKKRSLPPSEVTRQQSLLHHSAQTGITLRDSLCRRLDALLHPTQETAAASSTSPPEKEQDDIYSRYADLSTTRHHDNLSPVAKSRSRLRVFLNEARRELGMDGVAVSSHGLRFRKEHGWQGSEECFVDGRYLVWLCGMVSSGGSLGGEEQELEDELDAWHRSVVELLTSRREEDNGVLWRLLLRHVGLNSETVVDQTTRYLDSFRGEDRMGVYFQWPSFLRDLVLGSFDDGEEQVPRGNKRRKSNDGSVLVLSQYRPISLLERMDPEVQQRRNAWLPLLGYVVTHAYLSRDSVGTTIHETMDYLQTTLVPSFPAALGLDSNKRRALLSGMAGCLIDKLGEALALATLSLKDDEAEEIGPPHQQQNLQLLYGETESGSILGVEVAQIIALLSIHDLCSYLAKSVNCPLAGLVSETAITLLDYSVVHHRLHHEASPMANEDAIEHLMAKDALIVMRLIDNAYPQLKREILTKKFTRQTFHYYLEEDPRKHPIITLLRCWLVSGNLEEGAKLCSTLKHCSGIEEETERCCWYYLLDKMHEFGVLFEHDWNRNQVQFLSIPIMDRNGKMSTRKVGNVTLANLEIGSFGRKVVLEYLKDVVETAKSELFSGPKAFSSNNKQQFTAIKDAVRRTALKFLLPRPHPAAEVLVMATYVSEADKPPLLKHHSGPPKDENVGQFCCKILQEPSLLKCWEEHQAALEDEQVASAAAEQQASRSEIMPRPPDEDEAEEETREEEGGVLDMSMEIIPPTPAKSPEKPPLVQEAAADDEVIELGDSEDDSITKSLGSSSHASEVERDQEEYLEESVMNYPPHFHQYAGNYSESDDYDDEDEEEDNRRVAFEGPYDAEEGRGTRGNSSSGGSVEVFDIMSSSENDEDEDATPQAEPLVDDSSADDEYAETAALNSVVDDYIGAASQSPQAEEGDEDLTNDGKILHDYVHEYIPVSSPLVKSPGKDDICGKQNVPNETEEAREAHTKAIVKEDVMASEREDYGDSSIDIDVEQHPDPVARGISGESEIDHEGVGTVAVSGAVFNVSNEQCTRADPDTPEEGTAIAQVQSLEQEPVVLDVDDDSHADCEGLDGEYAPSGGLPSFTATPTIAKTEGVNDKNVLARTKCEDEAEKSYSSDGGNLGGELSEDMQADDEHESLDTEDDKRSLAEQGETFDEEEAGPTSPVHYDGTDNPDIMMDQPSILVAAAMSSQHQGSSYPMVMTKSYHRSSIRSVDNNDAVAESDMNVEAAQSNEDILAQSNDQDLQSPPTNEHIVDSDVEEQEGGQLTDDGYVPDAEATEEEKMEKTRKVIDDGYVPDAEVTEEESSKPIGSGSKAMKKRDVRFEAVIETREASIMPPPPVEPAANHSIDEGYLPDGALTEEEKRERQTRRSRRVEDGYMPDDGHTTATDDDTTDKKDRRSPHRKVVGQDPEVGIDPTLLPSDDEGYLPSAVEGTEEERSEEESQEAVASVLVATALRTQKGKGASDIANKASLATKRIKKPSLSTQSIDEGYLPTDGTFDEGDGRKLRKETRTHDVDTGYLPEGATTPGEATEEDQPDDKSRLLLNAKLKLSESVNTNNTYKQDDRVLTDAIPSPPIEPAATHSIDDGYLPSAVEEERSEEEDAITDKTRDCISQDTEEESLAITSCAEDTVKHSKFDNDAIAAAESDKADVALKEETGNPPNAIHHASSDKKVTDTTSQFNSKDNKSEADAQLLQPITENSLSLPTDLSSKSKSPEVNVEINEIQPKDDILLEPTRGSRNQTLTHHAESDIEQHDLESVQSETSSVRRSSRIRAQKSSLKVPSSITTGSRGKSVPALPAVPEDEKLEDPDVHMATSQSHVSLRTNRKGKQEAKASVDDSSSIKEEGASIASRTRRRGKRGANDDDEASHASSVNDESSTATSKSKRTKTAQVTKQAAKQNARGKQMKRNPQGATEAVEEAQNNASESAPSLPAKSRRGRSKIIDDQEDESKPVETPPKARGKNNKKESKQEVESASSLGTRSSRRTRRGAKDNASQSTISPPKTRGRKNKKDEAESSAAPTPSARSSRRTGGTRKTAPSEGSESIASSRPRRSTRASKK